MPACPRCSEPMTRKGAGWWVCPAGHGEWLDDEKLRKQEPPPTPAAPEKDWLGRPREPQQRQYVSMSLVGSIKLRGGGRSSRQKSPQQQKLEAWRRRKAQRKDRE